MEGYFKGDPVQCFKRIQYQGKRTMWSDVLIGQAPLFAVDKAVELHIPSHDIPAYESLKLQLSYDYEKFTSEWLTVGNGQGTELDMIMVVFAYSGADIHEVRHKLTYKHGDKEAQHSHRTTVTIAYHWIEELETDTRSGLNFLFVAGCFLTLLAIVAVALDSGDLTNTRALLVPEYEDSDRKRPKVKKFTLFQKDETGENDVPTTLGAEADRHTTGAADQEGLRSRGGETAGGEAGVPAAAESAGGKAD